MYSRASARQNVEDRNAAFLHNPALRAKEVLSAANGFFEEVERMAVVSLAKLFSGRDLQHP
jgi:hypothetical protein